jgi:OOP family OmpA-OmpF porin
MRISILLMVTFSVSFGAYAQLENLGKTVNSEYNEISPIISPDGKTIYFSRVSHPQNTRRAEREPGHLVF